MHPVPHKLVPLFISAHATSHAPHSLTSLSTYLKEHRRRGPALFLSSPGDPGRAELVNGRIAMRIAAITSSRLSSLLIPLSPLFLSHPASPNPASFFLSRSRDDDGIVCLPASTPSLTQSPSSTLPSSSRLPAHLACRGVPPAAAAPSYASNPASSSPW
jgi:hypothetical protein